METKCALCGQNALLKCSACHGSFYCSKEHQKKDWKTHKKICRAFKVVENTELGRHLIATRQIQEGELILQEAPLVSGPPQVTPPLCLGCYKLLNQINSQECVNCGWPVCCDDCQQSQQHQPECFATSQIRQIPVKINHFQMTHPSYQCIIVLRCLLQKKFNNEVWLKLNKLQSHCKDRKKNGKYDADKIVFVDFIHNFFKLTEFSEDEILKFAGIVQVNAHEVPLSETGYVSIYETASFLEHSCFANCCKSYTNDGSLSIRAATMIQPGQHLSICYTDPLWGTTSRRYHLYETKYFSCYCCRCVDPTELDTNFSSILCTASECNGNMIYAGKLPEYGQENLEESFWQCQTCQKTQSSNETETLLENIGRMLSQLKKNNVAECKNFIKNIEKLLHRNHYYLTDVKLAMMELMGQDEQGLSKISEQDLELKLKYCEELIKLTTKLVPAENRVRGVLLFELHAAIAEKTRRRINLCDVTPEEIQHELMRSRRVLIDAIRLLSYEPDVLPEGGMAIQAQKNLEDIDNWIRAVRAIAIADQPQLM